MTWKLVCSFRGMTLLFEDESARPIARTKPVPSAFFSLLVHLGVVILLLWLSFSPDVFMIPDNLRRTMLVAPLPPPPPPPPPPTSIAVKASVRSAPSKFTVPNMANPLPSLSSAKDFVIAAEEPPALDVFGSAPGGVVGGVPGGVAGGVPGGLPTFAGPVASVPSAAPAPKATVAPPPERIQVSGEVQEAMLLAMVKPQYPPVAKQARIQGTVRVSAIIDKDGRITELKVEEGHPFLVDAAVAVLKRWRYRPTILNGAPVEVATQITMHFRLEN